MTLRDEFEKIMAAADYVHADDMRWLLRTHGPAMLEALVDAERLDFADAVRGRPCYATDGTDHESIRAAIDYDRARGGEG